MLLGLFPSHFGRGVQTTRHRSDSMESYARRRRRLQGRQLVAEPGPQADMELRGFMLYMFRWTLFASASDRVSLQLLPFLRDFEAVGTYSWGSALLAFLFHRLSAYHRGVYFVGLWPLVQVVSPPFFFVCYLIDGSDI